MTLTELQTYYTKVFKMITKERRMRQSVLANSPLLKEKLDECDQALAAVVAMKDELKRLLSPAAQETLFDVPKSKKIGGY